MFLLARGKAMLTAFEPYIFTPKIKTLKYEPPHR
jgi:hypothetical protein